MVLLVEGAQILMALLQPLVRTLAGCRWWGIVR
jgi:hypothetical protein